MCLILRALSFDWITAKRTDLETKRLKTKLDTGVQFVPKRATLRHFRGENPWIWVRAAGLTTPAWF